MQLDVPSFSDIIDVSMSNKILHCVHGDDKINLKTTTYWYPLSINRIKLAQMRNDPFSKNAFSNDVSYIEAEHTSSFSYIRKDLHKFPYMINENRKSNKYLIYNNEDHSLVSRTNIFCAYPADGDTGPNFSVCKKSFGISYHDSPCGLNSCKNHVPNYQASTFPLYKF